MDNKTIFVRTGKGEDEMQGKSKYLGGDVRRALLLVDGSATFGEITKRAAPSMRVSLSEMFLELEKGDFIQEKEQDKVKVKAKIDNVPKMSIPVKMATPKKQQMVEDVAGELDFMSGFTASPPEVPNAEAVRAEQIRAEAEEKSRKEAEAEKIRAQQEAQAILLKAEQEAARIREETARRAEKEAEATRLKAEQEAKLRLEAAAREKQQAEAARIKAEQEAKKVREELEAARLKAEQEAQLRIEVAAREKQQAEAVRIKLEQEAAQARIELEIAKTRAELEAKARLEAAALAQAREDAERIAKQEQDAARAREAAASEQAAREIAAKTEKPASFAFDTFQVDQPLYTSESHLGKQPAQKAGSVQQSAPAQQPAPVAKAVQPAEINPAETQQPAKQQQVPIPAASKATDGKPTPEQIQIEMQERKAVEERMAAEALEAKKMAEAQAKAWADAEQRAIEAARAEVEQAAKHATYTVADMPPAAKTAPAVARVRRQPFSFGKLVGFLVKLGIFLLVLLAGALFVIPYVIPMRDYMPKAEQMLSEKLHQPVHIGRLSGRILPMPRLELGEIYIGDAKQFQADDAKINFALIGLLTDEKPVSSVEFQGVKVRGAWIRNVSAWMQQMANDNKYPVSRMVISQGKLDADVFELTGIEGELDFDSDGKFSQTNLQANGGKYALGINVTPENKLRAAITVHGSALPLLPNWMFDELTAKGELNNNELVISDFDARILGGAVQGNANINWHSGWNAQGALSAKTITMQQLNHLLDGNLEGSARFKMASKDLGGLADSAMLDGNFIAKNGMIGGMDIVETARTRSRENRPGGRTHFDSLSGVVSYANNGYHFKQVKVAAGVLNATATFDVTKQQMSGKMNVNLSMQDVSGPVDLQMDGTIDSPTLRYAP